MIEIPESNTLARQLTQTIRGKTIQNVIAGQSPHKFAWYFGDPSAYHDLLSGKRIDKAAAVAGQVEIWAEDCRILLNDGVNLRYFAPGEELPKKHQLKIEFEDSSSLVGVVQMYGGLFAFPNGKNDNPYYLVAKEKPSPLTDEFNEHYFETLLAAADLKKLSAKAFLATEQRIPGLGNGVLQDILWNAKVHPKRKMITLTDAELAAMFRAVKSTLFEMTLNGGRDTERDLFGCPGGYKTILSKNTVGSPCPVCGGTIQKQAYLGGSIYVCEQCQPDQK
ncbi:MAG TPA: endonuclease VIII [Oscillospiraceae bacterium]|nr:endonuclease VIII [Oscillospiraceae bacterium]